MRQAVAIGAKAIPHGLRLFGDSGDRVQRQEIVTSHPTGLEPHVVDRLRTEVHMQRRLSFASRPQPQGPRPMRMSGVHRLAINSCPNVAGWPENHDHRLMSRNRAGFTRRGSRTSSRAIHTAAGSCASSATSATVCSHAGASFGERGRWFAICRRNSSPSGSRGIGRASASGGSFRNHSGRLAAAAASARAHPRSRAQVRAQDRARAAERRARRAARESSRRGPLCASAALPGRAPFPGSGDDIAEVDVPADRNARPPGEGPARDSMS